MDCRVSIGTLMACLFMAAVTTNFSGFSSAAKKRSLHQASPSPVVPSNNDDLTGRDPMLEFMEAREEIYAKRRQLLSDTCIKYRLGEGNNRGKAKLAWINTFRLAYCATPKTSSTTWLEFFKKAERIKNRTNKWYRTSVSTTVNVDESGLLQPRSAFTFTFVRHPFLRVASAYQNKIIDVKLGSWRKRFQIAIDLGMNS